MAQGLPYFKFNTSNWQNGSIEICTREDKGLFIDLCALYWSRLGDLPFKLAVQKLCGGNSSAFDSLIKEEIFILDDGFVRIKFLDEQLQEFDNISNQNSKNAKEGWKKRRKQKGSSERNATASNPQSENDAIRVDKNRDRGDKINKIILSELSDSDVSKPEFLLITKKFHELFIRNVESLGGSTRSLKKAKGIQWYNDVRLMFEQDKVKKDDLLKVYHFLEKSDFWKKNILSTSKLRKQFDKLLIEANSEAKKAKPGEPPKIVMRAIVGDKI